MDEIIYHFFLGVIIGVTVICVVEIILGKTKS